jgi:hypothetical protein
MANPNYQDPNKVLRTSTGFRPHQKVQIDNISEKANVTKAAVSRYFADSMLKMFSEEEILRDLSFWKDV